MTCVQNILLFFIVLFVVANNTCMVVFKLYFGHM